MVTAQPWPITTGWQYINDTATFNPIKASVVTLQNSAGSGLAWVVFIFSVILIVPSLIYIRTQNIIASLFGLLIITMAIQVSVPTNGQILMLYKGIYIVTAIGLGVAIAFKWLAKKGE